MITPLHGWTSGSQRVTFSQTNKNYHNAINRKFNTIKIITWYMLSKKKKIQRTNYIVW